MKCWQKLLPTLGTDSVQFSVYAFIHFRFNISIKKKSKNSR